MASETAHNPAEWVEVTQADRAWLDEDTWASIPAYMHRHIERRFAIARQQSAAPLMEWMELRPHEDGSFDELVARFADGMVHVETMSGKGVYIGFYHDDGRGHQLWISSDKKLRYNEASANGKPPRFTAQGVDRQAAALGRVGS